MPALSPDRTRRSGTAILSSCLIVIAYCPFQLNADSVDPYIRVLGIAQDGGYPHAGCRRECCLRAWEDPTKATWVTCLAIVDPQANQRWLVECTPDFKYQLHALQKDLPPDEGLALDGIFLTHAHVGHYAGLVNLGREVMGARRVPVYVMPRMDEFLRTSGPWSQLVELQNIQLRSMKANTPTDLNGRLSITPVVVPHRDEFSETVGFRIQGPNRTVLFLPDIDKWERWDRRIEDELDAVDVAYLDGTFFDADELPERNMDEIPHPFVVETIERFMRLSPRQRAKVRFLHLNHSNPLLNPRSAACQRVQEVGMNVARLFEQHEM